jgi:hypothetical protein
LDGTLAPALRQQDASDKPVEKRVVCSAEQTDRSDDNRPRLIRRSPEATAEEVVEANERFKDTIRRVRLVRDMRTNQLAGIATWNADSWSWDIQPVETPAQQEYRKVGIYLLTDLLSQVGGPIFEPPTDLDQLVDVATDAIDPSSIALKLCNAAAQGVAHACHLGFLAPAIGKLVEQTLAPLFAPPDRISRAEIGLQVLDVTTDISNDRLTGIAYDLSAGSIDAEIMNRTRGISPADLAVIEEAINQGKATTRRGTLR